MTLKRLHVMNLSYLNSLLAEFMFRSFNLKEAYRVYEDLHSMFLRCIAITMVFPVNQLVDWIRRQDMYSFIIPIRFIWKESIWTNQYKFLPKYGCHFL